MSYKLTIQNAQLFENGVLPGTTVQLYQQVNDDLQLVASESEVPSAITTDINGVYDIEQIYRLDLATANVLELFLHGGRNFAGQVFFQDLVVTAR